MSTFVVNQIIGTAKAMLDRVGIGQKNPQLYNTFLSNIQNPQSDLHRMMMDLINTQTRGQWVNGIHEQDLVNTLRPWINNTLNYIENQLRQQMQGPQMGYGQPAPMGYQPQGYQGYGYQPPPPPGFSSTGGLYDNGGSQMSAPPNSQWRPDVNQNITVEEPTMDSFDLGRPVSFKLNLTDTIGHHEKPGKVVTLDEYREGQFESTRISTIELILNTAENSAMEAATKALAYSPNECIRGRYANVIKYKHLVHVPIGLEEFRRISGSIGEKFYEMKVRKTPDWRSAVQAMGSLTRAEHKVFETIFLQFLNPSLIKFLRTTAGNFIEGIEEIDDLKELDNPKSSLSVTKHHSYLSRFNEITTRAFDILLNPSNLIDVNDKNFGDFIHCDKIEFWYDDRSKYDYGTYSEKVDKMKFISSMTEHHTVLRIERFVIVTNAIDYRQAKNIAAFRPKDSVNLDTTQNVGCQLLRELSRPKSAEIEGVVCIGEGKYEPNLLIRLGQTLDGSQVLIK